MTLRPLGPRVDFTASASWSTPASKRARASAPKRSSFAIETPLFEKSGMISNGPLALRHEDGAASYPAGVEVGEGVGGGGQGVGLGVEGDLAGLGEGHKLGEPAVGADDFAVDVGAGGDGGRGELDACPGGRQQVLRHPAVGGEAGEGAVLAVHVVAGPAGVAEAA